MADRLVLVAGDTGPDLELNVRRNGRPWAIPVGASVSVRVEREAQATLTKAATIVDADAGRVRVQWAPGDLEANGTKPANYIIATRVLEAGGDVHHDGAPLRAVVRPLDEGLAAQAPGPAPELGAILTAAMAALDLELDNHKSGATQDHALAHLSDVADGAPADLNVLRRIGGAWQGVDLFAGAPVPAAISVAGTAGVSTIAARADHAHPDTGLATDVEVATAVATADATAVHKAGVETVTGSKTFTAAIKLAAGITLENATGGTNGDLWWSTAGLIIRRQAAAGVALELRPNVAANVGLLITLAASATGNVLEVRDNAAAMVAHVTAAGRGYFGAGTLAAPGISFEADPATGLFGIVAGQMVLAAAGVNVLQATNAKLIAQKNISMGTDGTPGFPALTRETDQNTGLRFTGTADEVALVSGGVDRLIVAPPTVAGVAAARIVSAIAAAADPLGVLLELNNNQGSANDAATIILKAGGTTGSTITHQRQGTLGGDLVFGTGALLADAAVERFRITRTGDLVARRTSPLIRLEDTRTVLLGGDVLGTLEFYGNDISGSPSRVGVYAAISGIAAKGDLTNINSAANEGGELRFHTSVDTASLTPLVLTERMRLNRFGDLTIGTPAFTAAGRLYVLGDAPSAKVAVLRAAAGQTANIFEAQDGAGAVLARLDAAGNLGIGTTAPGALVDIASAPPWLRLTDTRNITWAGGESHGGIEWWSLDPSAPGVHALASIELLQRSAASTPTGDLALSTYPAGGPLELERVRIRNDGTVGIGTPDPTAQLHVIAGAVGTVGLIVKLAAGATANALEARNSADAVVLSVNPTGGIVAPGNGAGTFLELGTTSSHQTRLEVGGALWYRWGGDPNAATKRFHLASNVTTAFGLTGNDGGGLRFMTSAAAGTTGGILSTEAGAVGGITARGLAATNTPLRARGFAAQTANLFEAVDDAATVLAGITADGRGFFGAAGPFSASSVLSVQALTTAMVPMRTRGIVGQTGDLFRAETSAGTAVVTITAGGDVTLLNGAITGRYFYPTSGAVGDVPVKVKGFAAQTADLTQWLDSAAAVKASVSASFAFGVKHDGDDKFVAQTAGGGRIFYVSQAAGEALVVADSSSLGSRTLARLKAHAAQTHAALEVKSSANVDLAGILASGAVVIDTATVGLVLRSPNGHYWRGTVSDAGALTFADLGLTRPTT